MKRFKAVLLVFIAAIVSVIAYTLWSNRPRVAEKPEEPAHALKEGADKHLEKIRLVEDKQGKRTWELEAKSVQQIQNQLILEEVKVTFYTKDGDAFVLSGRQGRIDQDRKDMKLTGDVVLTSKKGIRFKTQSVDYFHNERKVTTADPVEIEGEDIRLTGRGLRLDIEAQTLKILHEVKTRWSRGGKG